VTANRQDGHRRRHVINQKGNWDSREPGPQVKCVTSPSPEGLDDRGVASRSRTRGAGVHQDRGAPALTGGYKTLPRSPDRLSGTLDVRGPDVLISLTT